VQAGPCGECARKLPAYRPGDDGLTPTPTTHLSLPQPRANLHFPKEVLLAPGVQCKRPGRSAAKQLGEQPRCKASRQDRLPCTEVHLKQVMALSAWTAGSLACTREHNTKQPGPQLWTCILTEQDHGNTPEPQQWLCTSAKSLQGGPRHLLMLPPLLALLLLLLLPAG